MDAFTEDEMLALGIDDYLEDVEPSPDPPSRSEALPEPEGPDDELQALVTRAVEEARQHYQEQIEPDQVRATKYYLGRPFGDEQEGRSQVVSTDVRDATLAQLPSLLRMFSGSERVCEFSAATPDKAALAEQVTDMVNHVFMKDNPGFLVLQNTFKDSLIRETGIVKAWWEDDVRVRAFEYQGLSLEQAAMLEASPGVEMEILGAEEPEPQMDPETGEVGEGDPLLNVRITYRAPSGRIRVEAVPNEEIVWTPNARSLHTSPLVAHVREVPEDELRALGVPEDMIEEARAKREGLDDDRLESIRQFESTLWPSRMLARDKSQELCILGDVYLRTDRDGDGSAELRRFITVGPQFKIVPDENGSYEGEIVDKAPFAIFPADPEPHTMRSLSNYHYLHDVQRVKSQILRGTLDSLAEAIDPVKEVVQGEVNMGDLLNPEARKIVRVRRPGMMREVKHQFVGAETLPMLEYYDQIREERVRVSKAAEGLDADALQSSTKQAVAATLTGAQQRIEMIARVWAETGMKDLMLLIADLLMRHQDRPRTVRLRGEYVEVDPRTWDLDLDVQVNVAIGQGTTEEHAQFVGAILGKQEQMLQMGSPLVTNVEYRYALAKMVDLAGFKDANKFFRPWNEQSEMEHQQALAQQPPPPDPAMILTEIEAKRVEGDQMLKQAEIQLRARVEELKDDRERDKLARDTALREAQIGANVEQRAREDREIQDENIEEADAEAAGEAMLQELDQALAEQEAQMMAEMQASPPMPPEMMDG